ncbi:putative holin-like toxin [Companilactobacillus halodurans]
MLYILIKGVAFLSVSNALNLMLTFGIFLIALLTYIHSDKK